jgi:plastocyanin
VKRRHPLLLGSVLALVAAAPAAAAEVTIGSDETDGAHPVWSPASVAIQPGDTVRWNLTSALSPPLPHDVLSTAMAGDDSWSFEAGSPEGTYTFTTPGRYRFYCRFHSDGSSGMVGTVVVGNPPPPPPPPPGETPWPNDSSEPAALEVGGLDRTKPTLSRVSARRSGKRVQVSFKVSEQSVVTVRLARRGKSVKTKKARTSGRGSVTVAGLKAGRYSVKVTATDVAGNHSGMRTAHLTVT